MLSLVARLFKALNSDSAPGQVAFGFALAMIPGFTPFFSLLTVLVLLIACILRINLSAFILGVIAFSVVGYALDPVSANLGEWILTLPGLTETFTSLYQNEWFRISAFNNTVTMGGLVIALALLIPVTLISRILILQYRKRLLSWVNKLKIVQVLNDTESTEIYTTFAE